MRESDLSVKDWAHLHYKNGFDGEVSFDFRVTRLTMHYGNEILVWGESTDGKHHGNMGEVSKIEPVPLTTDTLKKNGWFCHNDFGRWEHNSDHFALDNYGDGFSVEIPAREYGYASLCYIKYVHELQHLLRICGANEMADCFEI